MYQSLFQLSGRPFAASPHPDVYFPARTTEEALETLTRCIQRAEGPALLIGPAGTGKTLLCQVLAERLQETYQIAMLNSGRLCTRRALLQAILYELGLPYRDREEGELRLSLIDHLAPGPQCPHGMLLLLDEAHTLPLRLLEEVRLITNLVRDGEPRARLMLAGGSLLDERLVNPKLESFNQRIAARCYLESLNREETSHYVRAQITRVGGDPERIFADGALGAIYDATDGIPRLINQVADHALLMASVGQREQVDSSGVEQAWADLQQLPAPCNEATEPGGPASDGDIIEYGGLDDELSEPPQSVPFPAKQSTRAADAADSELGQSAIHPDEQLEQIQRQVSQVSASFDDDQFSTAADHSDQEEEFRPVGTIVPELELHFNRGHAAFNERYQQEEVVIDRYASLEDESLRGRPRVSSDVGRELAALLEEGPGPKSSSSTTLALQKLAQDAPLSSTATGDEKQPQLVSGPAISTAAAVRTEGTVTSAADDPVHPEYEAEPSPATTGQQQSGGGRKLTELDDRDLIVVEDEPALPTRQAASPQTGRVRRQEYRRLFAKLRRG